MTSRSREVAYGLTVAMRSRCFWAVMFIVAMLFWLLQWAPGMPGPTLDWSWIQVMYAAHREPSLQFGRDIAFVYGPLGFVQLGLYVPGIYLWAISIRALVLVVLGVFYCKILRPVSLPLAIPLAAAIVIASTYSLEAALGSASVVVILMFCEAGASMTDFAGLALMCGLIALMKFTYFIALGGVYAVMTLYRALRWREYPLPMLLYAVVLMLAYLLSGQHLTSFPEYIRRLAQLRRGSWRGDAGFRTAAGNSQILHSGRCAAGDLWVER